MTVNVELIRDEAIFLLSNMERLNLIRLNTPLKSTKETEKKLSERFAGALRLSHSEHDEIQNSLSKSRDEWKRDIY